MKARRLQALAAGLGRVPASLFLVALLGLIALMLTARGAHGARAPQRDRPTGAVSNSPGRLPPRTTTVAGASHASMGLSGLDVARLTRFGSWLTIGLAGAFLVVASTSFAASSVVALALGISIGTLVVALAIADRNRSQAPTLLAAFVTALLSVWTIVASQVFAPATAQELALAGSLALSGVAVVGLTVHELSGERGEPSVAWSRRRSDPPPPGAPPMA
jgi:hypothetical protein